MRLLTRILLGTVALSLFSLPAKCDEAATTGRQAITKWQDAIVTVQLVVKMSMSVDGKDGRKDENKAEATGLVIDPSGLIVSALSATDPQDMIRQMMSADAKVDISSEVSSVKILTSDGKEIPGKIVLRDKDLDLVFIRPTQKPANSMTAVDLSKSSKPAQLDQVLTLYKQGPIASRSLAACIDRIQAVVEKPRTFYIPGSESSNTDPGAVVFGMDSNPIGMMVGRLSPKSGGNFDDMFIVIVLPAADIAEAAKQAP